MSRKQINFDPVEHKYTLDGKTFISGTQFLERFHEHFDLDGCAEAYAEKNLIPKSSVLKLWDVNRELGTDLHEYMEYQFKDRKKGKPFSIQGDKVKEIADKYDLTESEVELRMIAGINALKQCEEEMLLYDTPEIMVYVTREELSNYFDIPLEHLMDDFGGISGTADLLLKDKDNIKYIRDWKFCKSIEDSNWKDEYGFIKTFNAPISHLADNKLTKYSLQLNLYKWIMEKFYNYEFDIASYYKDQTKYYKNHRLLQISSASNHYEMLNIKVLDEEIESMVKWFFVKDEFKEEYCL